MKVSSCSYYRYVKGATYRESLQKAERRARGKACFIENSRRYGVRRRRQMNKSAIVHTDRGSQYASVE